MKYLYYTVMMYMLLALGWWTVLLLRTHNELYNVKTDLVSIQFQNENSPGEISGSLSQELQSLTSAYHNKKLMILGESMVFGLSLVLGLSFIRKSYQNTLIASKNEKNFLLSVTHELKSPLAAIKLIGETFQKRHLSNEQSRQLQDNLCSETNRLESLINNILMASKVRRDFAIQMKSINVQPVIEKIIQNQLAMHPYVDLQFNTHGSCIAHVDQDAFSLIISNLIENAIKYSMPYPSIVMNAECKEGTLHVTIADNGIGIPVHERELIFRRFYRIGDENTRSTQGTGLGLYIVKSLVEAMKGKIIVRQNTPKGTIFEVTIKS